MNMQVDERFRKERTCFRNLTWLRYSNQKLVVGKISTKLWSRFIEPLVLYFVVEPALVQRKCEEWLELGVGKATGCL